MESSYRLAFAVVMSIAAAVAIYHRWRAASGERISRQEEGLLFAFVLRFAGFCLGMSGLAYLLVPEAIRWAALPFPAWLRWTGAVGGLVCSALMYWTLSSLGGNLTDTVVTRQQATLVTEGPYRWVRHPYYVTAALLMASATLLTANGLFGFCCLVVLVLLAVRTPKEEEVLCERFGGQYRDYRARTGCFWPRFRRVARASTGERGVDAE